MPVAVLLFVLVLAMMGRRWTSPAYAAEVEIVEDPMDLVDDFEPLPYSPAPVGQRPSYESDRYESPLDHRYGSLARRPSSAYDTYNTRRPEPQGSGELELYGAREVEVYTEPEPEEPRGFPYGPYRHN